MAWMSRRVGILLLGLSCLTGARAQSDKVKQLMTKAQAGDASAQNSLGASYFTGDGIAKDYEKALYWYEKSAAQGYAFAQCNLGDCYYYGNGVAQDYVKAAVWYEKSARQRNAQAQSQLGEAYYYGRGVLQDYGKAVEWFWNGASQGNANAQCYLGICYYYGRGVTRDFGKACEWYEKSAQQGNQWGQFNLGTCYEDGLGVAQDKEKALSWYRKAAAQGHEMAKKKVLDLSKSLPVNEQNNVVNVHTEGNTQSTTGNRPTLIWNDFSEKASQAAYTLRVSVQSDSKVDEVTLEVNGQKYRGVSAVANDGSAMNITEKVTLRQGENLLRVTARNAAGTAVSERTVQYRPATNETVVPATTGKRIALVIGNADYAGQKLVNPTNDAQDISAKLKTLGFETFLVLNKNKRGMEDAIRELSARAKNYDAALFYYAGHGIQYGGRNYLVPVDAELKSESDVEYDCTDANRVLAALDESGCKMKIVILDACRNNPFERSWTRSRGGNASRGLVQMNAPAGTVIAYATSPGSVAQDGDGRNSPYAAALLKTLDKPNLTIFDFFNEVATQVYDNTKEQQMPWNTNSPLRGKFYFNLKP